MICLPKKIADNFIEGLKSGKLNPEELAKMTTEERRAVIEQFVGSKPAEQVNALFEKKLLLKNQNDAMIGWVKEVAGLKEATRKDLLAKIERLGNVLTPAEEDKFLADLVSEKLGTRTSVKDAENIAKLAKEFADAKANPNSGTRYGAAQIELHDYMNNLRLQNEAPTLKSTLGKFKANPVKEVFHSVSDLAGFAKGVKASLDNSAIFRQGWKTMFTNPDIWAKNALQSFQDIAKQLRAPTTADGKLLVNQSDEVMKGIKAEIYSRPNARSGMYEKLKLDIGNLEEAYPSTLPEKLPIFGKIYKASETAYTGFLYRMRADIADQMVKKATEAGVDLSVPLQAESIGKLINSLTGRGKFSAPIEGATKEFNTVFFSPKMLKANFDFLTLHAADEMSGFARKQAAQNLAKALVGTSLIMATAEALHPGSIELDPRSSDFGKIRIGDTRYDISGGMGSLITLSSRILPALIGQPIYTKSSTTGKITRLNENKFGAKNGMDIVVDFGENKFAPLAAVLMQQINQKDFEGNKITPQSQAVDLLAPLPIDNLYKQLHDPKADQVLASFIADGLGISTNTYHRKK